MPRPEPIPKYNELNLVDRTIARIVETLDKEISQSDFNKVAVMASVQSGIDRYRQKARDMTTPALETEQHKSVALGKHLEEKFGPRPPRTHAHAIVAGKHQLAAPLRLAMAFLKIRIDDVDNGCWLPENTAATPHPAMPKAPPHSRIHRYNYYFWISSRLTPVAENETLFRTGLKILAREMYTGSHPDYLLLPKGRGIV